MKVARTVWSGGKFGDKIKGLPITIPRAQLRKNCAEVLWLSRISGRPAQPDPLGWKQPDDVGQPLHGRGP